MSEITLIILTTTYPFAYQHGYPRGYKQSYPHEQRKKSETLAEYIPHAQDEN